MRQGGDCAGGRHLDTLNRGKALGARGEETHVRRIFATVVLALGLPLIPSAPATATPPERSTFQIDDVFPFDVCPFPLMAHVVGMNHRITFVDASGNPTREFLGGQLFITFTRDDTGFSRRFTLSGPTFFDANGTPMRGTGRWVAGIEGVGYVIASGNLQFDIGLLVNIRGRYQELCDLISG